MKLRPVIASYTYGTGGRVRQYLTDEVMEIISGVTLSAKPPTEISSDVFEELSQMHVLKEQAGLVRLDTSVFLKEDIERIVETVKPLARELGQLILECGVEFQNSSPEITVFLGGIVGFVQGLGSAVGRRGISVDWKNYTGKYAQTKVDFDEECEALDSIGPDFLNKVVFPGERYSAVFIGPEGTTFHSFLPMGYESALKADYIRHLNLFLVDAYAMLINGEIENKSLRISAEAANLYTHGKPRTAIITTEIVERYTNAVQSINDVVSSFYIEKLEFLKKILRTTTAGRQGVRPANMMLNLFRYIRKLTAKELYSSGFFTDTIPTEGALTVFYENDIELIKRLLY
jgi:hypothetical protein